MAGLYTTVRHTTPHDARLPAPAIDLATVLGILPARQPSLREPPVDAPDRKDTPTPAFAAFDQLGLFVRGIAMGAADVVPGVSGGTIAFISGIYERFIQALRSLSPAFLVPLLRGDIKGAWALFTRIHWAVLLPVGAGVGAAIVTMSKLITGLMVDQPGPTYGFFFGLILASIWVPLQHMRTRRPQHGIIALLAAVGAFAFVGLQGDGISFHEARRDAGAETVFYGGKIRAASDLEKVRAFVDPAQGLTRIAVFDPKGTLSKAGVDPGPTVTVYPDKPALYAWLETTPRLVVLEEEGAPLWWLFLCGLLAISAMVLPGLSGSFLLLFLGQYHAVFSALHRVIGGTLHKLGRPLDPVSALTAHGYFDDILYVGVFGVGVLTGLVLFSRVVSWLFERAHDVTMAALAGLMLGALRQPAGVVLDATADGASWGTIIVVGCLGAALVTGLNVADAWFRRRRVERAPA
jgi:uncharacterized membrane protein